MPSFLSRVSVVSAVGVVVFLAGTSTVDSSVEESPRADRKALQKQTDLKKLNQKLNLFKNSKRTNVRVPAQYRGQSVGPDIVAWQICGGDDTSFDMSYYGDVDGQSGYAIATQSCNFGDIPAAWYGGTDDTPCIYQNLYRLKDGVFEQIGVQSYGKHSFCALSEPGCGNCQSTDCDTLGVGCADTYWADLNAGGSAPRAHINPSTGEYPWPFESSPSGPSTIRGMLVVDAEDVDPSNNVGARYFVEGMYVSQDDMSAGNGANNYSWKELEFSSNGNPSQLSNTNVGDPAIAAWAAIDSDVLLRQRSVPGDGIVYVGSRPRDLGNGNWQYQYVVFNLTSYRSVRRIAVPKAAGLPVNDIGFNDVDHNSGLENIIDSTDWGSVVSNDAVVWETQTFDENEDANAIYFGQAYTFTMIAPAPPEEGQVELSLFRPGTPDVISVVAWVPSGGAGDPCDYPVGDCAADLTGDDYINTLDLLALIGDFGSVGDGTFRPIGDISGDCATNTIDILALISAIGSDCLPRSACCLPNGDCVEDLTEAHCVDEGGEWVFGEVSCAEVSCPSPGACCLTVDLCETFLQEDCDVAGGIFFGDGSSCNDVVCETGFNDECSQANVIVLGENPIDTTEATNSDDPYNEDQCGGTYLGEMNQDIWCLFTSPGPGELTVSTCGSVNFDSDLVVYTGGCGDLNQVSCNGDGSGCAGYSSLLTLDVEQGETYRIRVGGWSGSDAGTGTLLLELDD